jgi:hypothetical protein
MAKQAYLKGRRNQHHYHSFSMASTSTSVHAAYRQHFKTTHNWAHASNSSRVYLFTAAPIGKKVVSGTAYKDRPASWVEAEVQTAKPDEHSRSTFGERYPDAPKHEDLTVALRRFVGRWVAIRGEEILASADTPLDLVNLLRDRGYKADSVFRVPRNAKEDILGEW